jgi:hypothetical protein
MNNAEIILNLWYVQDADGFIYSLRTRAYIGTGTDEEKLVLLQAFATTDYLIGAAFPVPDRFHIRSSGPLGEVPVPVCHRSVLEVLDSPIGVFEDAIRSLNAALPSQTKLTIGNSPLVCITSLVGDEHGTIRPVIAGIQRFARRSGETKA